MIQLTFDHIPTNQFQAHANMKEEDNFSIFEIQNNLDDSIKLMNILTSNQKDNFMELMAEVFFVDKNYSEIVSITFPIKNDINIKNFIIKYQDKFFYFINDNIKNKPIYNISIDEFNKNIV
jgi:hypothetical protein